MSASATLAPDWLNFVVCPQCRAELEAVPDSGAAISVRCTACGRAYPIIDGIPILLADRAVEQIVEDGCRAIRRNEE